MGHDIPILQAVVETKPRRFTILCSRYVLLCEGVIALARSRSKRTITHLDCFRYVLEVWVEVIVPLFSPSKNDRLDVKTVTKYKAMKNGSDKAIYASISS